MGRACFKYHKSTNAKVFLIVGSFLICSYEGSSARHLLDRVVASVNGVSIWQSAVKAKVSEGKPLIIISDFPAEKGASAESRALEDAINTQIVLQKADELHIEIPDEGVDRQVESIAKDNNNMSVKDLEDFFLSKGKTLADYKNDLKLQMKYGHVRRREITPSGITDSDVKAYYLKKYGHAGDVEFYLKQIMIAKTQGKINESKVLATKIYDELKAGLSFEKALDQYKSTPGVVCQNSSIKIGISELPADIVAQVKSLEDQSYTAPIKTENGFQILFLEKREFGQNLADKKKELQEELYEELTRQWLKRERARAKISMKKASSR